MIITISNKNLTATINTIGAELVTLVKNQKNYIWTVDENYWNRTSPVLFPIVGRLKNDSYTYNEKTYSLSRHGFARDMEFTYDKRSEHQVIFELNETEATKAVYPFNFKLFIAYTLMGNELVIEYFVRNQSDEVLPFSIGAHPAFAIEGDVNNYSLQFNKDDHFETHHLEQESFNGNTSIVNSMDNEISLSYDLFDVNALVFKQLKSNEVTLKKKDKSIVKVNFDHFPYLGIWTKSNAPFICIEPWCGLADNVNHDGNLEEKEGINLLQPHEDFLRAMRIEILE
ncbi:aldose 1-epimerase family protein [Flavobacterium urocaniciphilum]|uniref:Galactose mutarotase n=1 Tax=Flavobacterium urocaniciphilum TaxID=1299341 RepID=A0A1H9CPQ5_9FLAO|nr:aldose 1-epimerase family protein [Flavobacterium urocaniciphilum]SEQ03190.1 Galactose mutarotase [Flavobacterium urocaniciphilum]